MAWKIPVVLMISWWGMNAAWAWTAVAHHPQHGTAYVYYMAKSAEEAEKQALAGCERQARGCELLGLSTDGPMTTVLVRGKQGYTRADHADPDTAERRALQDCRQRDSDCRLVSAAWDRGTHIMAIAVDHEHAWVGPSLPTEQQAKDAALASCRGASRSAERCTIFHVLNGPGWIAVAQGPLNTGVGLSVRSPAVARNNALAECEAAKTAEEAGCKDMLSFHNPAGKAEPAAFRELVTRIRADKRVVTASVPPFLGKPEP